MKVVILAGGLGTRISEESVYKPKPMIEIGNMPILWHIMKEYSYYGFHDFVICAGYKQHMIKEWFADYFLHTSDITFDFTRGQNEMIISIMLNYVATLFMGVLYTSWIRDASVPQTPAVDDLVKLPRVITGMRFTWGFVIAVVVGLVLYYVLFWTSGGFKLRAVGYNMTASRFNGIHVKRCMLTSFIISGAIAGLGGGAELLGTQFRLINGFGAGYGFDGVAMALIGQLHPIATMAVALFFAVLRVGSTTMQAATGVPTSVSDIIQALVIVFSVAGMALTKLPEFQAWKDRVFSKRKAGDK